MSENQGREDCKQGKTSACDEIAEYWGARELLPEGQAESARQDAEALKIACESKQISSACMGYALMLKYGSATGQRDNDGGKPYWAFLPKLGDLNGFRAEISSEGQAALTSTKQACEQGRARACNQLGWAAYNGIQRTKSLVDSLKAYESACRLGSAHGCRWAGHLAFTYPELQQGERAREWMDKGCSLKNPGSCAELGQFLDKVKRGEQALHFYEQACAAGSRDGCYLVGKRLWEEKKFKEGFAQLRKVCDIDQEDACQMLGPILERGEGVPKDEAAAIQAYQKGCKGKLEESCAALFRLAGGGKGGRCLFEPQKPSRIGEFGIQVLQAACKEHRDASWCKGIVGCP